MEQTQEPSLFFVLGAPKSGTTWLQVALDRHPEITCKGEGKFHFFRDRLADAGMAYNQFLSKRNVKVFGSEQFPALTIEDVDTIFRVFIELRMRQGITKPMIKKLGSKDPDFGLYINEYAALFPSAAYLHIIRDPRDATLSMLRHMQRVHPEVDLGPTDAFLIDTARGWRSYIENVRAEVAARNLLYLEVTYEEMLRDVTAILGSVFKFLSVDNDPDVVAACVAASTFESLSGGRPSGQEDRSSFFRKGVADAWRDELTPPQAKAIMDVSGALAERLGYA